MWYALEIVGHWIEYCFGQSRADVVGLDVDALEHFESRPRSHSRDEIELAVAVANAVRHERPVDNWH